MLSGPAYLLDAALRRVPELYKDAVFSQGALFGRQNCPKNGKIRPFLGFGTQWDALVETFSCVPRTPESNPHPADPCRRGKAPTPKLEPVAAMKSDGGDPAAVSKAAAPTSKDDGSARKTEEPAFGAKKAWWSGGKEPRFVLRWEAQPGRPGP